jgi:hypothetical protein
LLRAIARFPFCDCIRNRVHGPTTIPIQSEPHSKTATSKQDKGILEGIRSKDPSLSSFILSRIEATIIFQSPLLVIGPQHTWKISQKRVLLNKDGSAFISRAPRTTISTILFLWRENEIRAKLKLSC